MNSPFSRKPLALANWKMAMTVSDGLAFVREFGAAVGALAQSVTIVLCPPYTAIHALSKLLTNSPIELGAQDFCAAPGNAHTGQISAPLLADAGCVWVMLGHWEVRRRTGETDEKVNNKMHAALKAELRPILLTGESAPERGHAQAVLAARLPDLFAGCEPWQIAQMTVLYEPEWTIGMQEPAPADYIASSCSFIRDWIGQEYGEDAANKTRIIYGGSVAPKHAEALLSSPDVDGLGAGRMGRDPVAFEQIVQTIGRAKGLV